MISQNCGFGCASYNRYMAASNDLTYPFPQSKIRILAGFSKSPSTPLPPLCSRAQVRKFNPNSLSYLSNRSILPLGTGVGETAADRPGSDHSSLVQDNLPVRICHRLLLVRNGNDGALLELLPQQPLYVRRRSRVD